MSRQFIDVYAVMRDEIKIVPYFLRHYETYADRIFVFDDHSRDGTRELLEAHPLVTLLPMKHHGADDGYYVRDLWPQYKQISRGKADWVIQVDADEFVYAENIRDVLLDYTQRGIKKCRITGFAMYSDVFPTTPGQIYEEVTKGWYDRWQKKTILFNPEIDIRFTPGRHQAYHNSKVKTYRPEEIRILHFRFLSLQYSIDRDKKNCANMGIPYNPYKIHNLPNKSRGNTIDFITTKQHLLVDALTSPTQPPDWVIKRT